MLLKKILFPNNYENVQPGKKQTKKSPQAISHVVSIAYSFFPFWSPMHPDSSVDLLYTSEVRLNRLLL